MMRNTQRIAAGAVIALSAMSVTSGCQADPPEPVVGGTELVSTPLGEVEGWRDGQVLRFEGVPYAEPPSGDRRFAAPEPRNAWSAPVEATEQGPRCPQVDGSGAVVGEEDCLRLDVTAPATPSTELRPVMVWLHGGGFTEGNGGDYDAARLVARGDVIVVSPNYRLGALGNLAASGLDDGGSFALLDQQEALRFVQNVAESFGGDPSNVTLFGESAGATSVCHQLLAPGAVRLFHRAILQSAIECGAAAPPNAFALPPSDGSSGDAPPTDLPSTIARGDEAAARLGCTDAVVSCLRDLPLAEVMKVHAEFARPATGTAQTPTPPSERLDEVGVPVLAGFNRDESRFYAILQTLLGAPHGPGSYEPAIRASFGDQADAVLREYPLAEFADDAQAWGAVYTDRTFACPQLRGNELMSQSTDVWAYSFDDRTAPSPLPLLPGAPDPGAAHSSELPYLFEVRGQPLDIEGNRIPLTVPQEELSAQMIDVWTGFARGDAPRDATWQADRHSLSFGQDGVGVGDPWTTHRCGFWDLD